MGQRIVDWSLIEHPDVSRMLKREAAKVARQYEGVLEVDDILQEGYIAVATQGHIVRAYLDNGDLGFLSRWIWQRLTNIAAKENTAHKRTTSFEEMDWDEL